MPKGVGYPGDAGHAAHGNSGTKKDRLPKATRVKSAGEGETKIAGSPQKANADMHKVTRAKKSPAFPRKNDPPQTSQSRLGLNVGTRVTSKETRKR